MDMDYGYEYEYGYDPFLLKTGRNISLLLTLNHNAPYAI